jgi:ribosomal protein S18 acetylase RimI-like enzyme
MRETTLQENPEAVIEIRRLLKQLGKNSTISDFEEHIQMDAARDSLRCWQSGDILLAFAYVDAYANLCFEIAPGSTTPKMEKEIVNWGVSVQKQRNLASGESATLDHSCETSNTDRLAFLQRNGFIEEDIRSLFFSRSLLEPLPISSFPAGYNWRSVTPDDPIETLVDLHRSAFGTAQMTVEYRQAIMSAPQYEMDLDLVAIAPDNSLAAFCICGIDENDPTVGYTDPIGTHQAHQKKGLAKTLVIEGLRLLKKRGVEKVEIGTSSENIAMQQLALALGFSCVSEKHWFSKEIG